MCHVYILQRDIRVQIVRCEAMMVKIVKVKMNDILMSTYLMEENIWSEFSCKSFLKSLYFGLTQ